VSEAGSHARERARHASEIARERAQRVKHEARMRAEQARVRFDNALEDNPLAVGVVALGLGAAVGLLLPSSSVEDRWFGEQRDRLLDQARGKAGEVGEAAREAMHKAREAAEQEAQKRGLLPGQAAAGARDILSQGAAAGREAFEKKIERPS
jgi:ElaB/YqjD/DUF883 family membrane-anchored ribosome-binding protein